MTDLDPVLAGTAVVSALFVSGLVLWRRLARPVQTKSAPTSLEQPVEVPQEPEKLRLVVILFGPESAMLSPMAVAALSEAARRLTDDPELTVTVEGSADATGNPSRNLVLAHERAQAATRFLLDRGVAAERVSSVVKPPLAGRTEYERQRLRCVRLTWG